MKKNDLKTYFISDTCLCWSFGDTIDPAISDRVLIIYKIIKSRMHDHSIDILDVVPSYNAIAVHFNPGIDLEKLKLQVHGIIQDSHAKSINRKDTVQHRLPVVYNGDDLQRVADTNGLTINEVIDIHKKGEYRVAMIGFKPYFPYLMGMDKRISTPRLDAPRIKIRAGAVGIGGDQTGIYPEDSPGGWNIIGYSFPRLLRSINPGDIIQFQKVKTL